jgi:hypothetical protein
MVRWFLTASLTLVLVAAMAADLSAARNKASFDKLAGEILESLQSF